MAVTMVTYRKGGNHDAMVAATRKLKDVLAKHGADSVGLNQVAAGPDPGQWVILIGFANWEAFGKTVQSALNDPAGGEAVAGLDAISEVVSRRVVAGIDL